ncbi:Uu.00g145200.m01.CDS01 [Anthostomella pinea]|uniref:Uu.00g145200.m01.CDS01 n=1 Tax=Anthostomella pinea TaxID=933095 RepID=A0AAI8VRT7_9PEZI|nr:Uu.00g145200.m01.CDS01 [Anthostomella pinea]
MKRVSRIVPSLLLQVGILQTCFAADVSLHDGTWQPEYVLVATSQDITVDCQQRYSVVFNGTSPGPPLYLKEGETTWVRVFNEMTDLNLTVHWHGLTMRTAPFSDGTPLVSQWPIGPGDYFDYEIHPEDGDAGTYFYHSHIGFQASTAHGILFVEDREAPPYQYDEDIPIMLGDFWNKTDKVIEDGLMAVPFEWSGEPNCLTLNDRSGTASFDDAADDSCKPYVITVEPGKTYRLRFVNGAALSFFEVGIEDHTNLTVISADGYYTKPATTDHIQIGCGQRFDALLTAKSEAELNGKDQYWIRYESRGRPTEPGGYALLQYDISAATNSTKRNLGPKHGGGGGFGSGVPFKSPGKNPDTPPVTLPADGDLTQWLEYTLESLNLDDTFPTLDEVTRTIFITVSQDIINGSYVDGSVTGSLVWEQNDISWTELEADALHYAPYLVQAYVTGKTPDYDAAVLNQGWDPNTSAFPAKVGETLDIVWQSNSGPTGGFDYHPMHAHGEHYWDLGSGNGTYDAVVNEEHFKNYTPAKRDTTMLHRYTAKGEADTTAGWRAWRIRITEDNVGAWMMHCHILQHMVMGMQTAWVYGDAASILKEIPEPYIAGYLTYGGDAYGNDTYDPLVLTYFDDESST